MVDFPSAVVLILIMCEIHSGIADCTPGDPNLTYRDPSPSFVPICEVREVERLGRLFYLGRYEDTQLSYASVTLSCYNDSGSKVKERSKSGIDSLGSRNLWRAFAADFEYNFGVRCDFIGCYENGRNAYRLDNSTCYIDFDECSSETTNDCDENARCVNDEEGTYTCTCNSGYMGNGTQCKAISPVLKTISADVVVLNGSAVTLSCTGSSPQGDVSITWSTSIPELTLPQPTVTTLDENSLSSSITLDSVDSSYDGEYICTVVNGFGHVNDSVSLTVIPILKVDRVIVSTGTNTSLFCNDFIEPDMNYSWDIELTNHTKERVDGILTNELTITDVGTRDSMKYTCNVSQNGKLVGVSMSYLYVKGPKIVKHPDNATLSSPLNFTLNCSAVNTDDATGNLSFHWMKNGRLLETPTTNTTTLSGEVVMNQLQVAYNISAPQMDAYQCLVTNRELQDATESLTAFITIHYNACSSDAANGCDRNARCIYDGGNGDYTCQCKNGYTGSGKVCYRVPNITVFDVPKVILSGSKSTLKCKATGHPMPHITWFHEQQLLLNNTHVTISSNSSSEVVESIVQFSLLTEEDSGEYICQANYSHYVIIKSQYVYVENSGLHQQSTQAVIGTSVAGVFILCLVVSILLGVIIRLLKKKERKYHPKCVNYDYKVDSVKIEDMQPYTA